MQVEAYLLSFSEIKPGLFLYLCICTQCHHQHSCPWKNFCFLFYNVFNDFSFIWNGRSLIWHTFIHRIESVLLIAFFLNRPLSNIASRFDSINTHYIPLSCQHARMKTTSARALAIVYILLWRFSFYNREPLLRQKSILITVFKVPRYNKITTDGFT